MQVFTKSGQVTLDKTHYIAGGGEGEIYARNGFAYKIYHDPAKMIPDGKILELAQINLSNVLNPTDIIKDVKGKSIGFVMKYVSDTEFLVKLFSKGFRVKNSIDEAMIRALALRMQLTTQEIHSRGILLVDLNEFNFLTSRDYTEVYFIDTDSYKTKSYPATALMESVRDRQVKNNQFTEFSDFYSLGITMFQLYTGVHPYKGKHPDFAARDWPLMMDKGISVFNKDCRMPPATYPLNSIPRGHLKWFEAIFEKGERSKPPLPDQVAQTVINKPVKVITGNDKFLIELVREYQGDILSAQFINGVCYIITHNTVYADSRIIKTYAFIKGSKRDIVEIRGSGIGFVEFDRLTSNIYFRDFNNNEYGKFTSSGYFIKHGLIYYVCAGNLIQAQLAVMGSRVQLQSQIVANIYSNHVVYDGVVIQNMLGTYRASIPYEPGRCELVNLIELKGQRIVSAKYLGGKMIVLTELGGKYTKYTLVFSKDHKTYNLREEKNVNLHDIEFIVKDNGVCLSMDEQNLEIFLDNSTIKRFNSPLDGDETLICHKNEVFYYQENKLFKIKSK
jgi:serine/threonine protein kinase